MTTIEDAIEFMTTAKAENWIAAESADAMIELLQRAIIPKFLIGQEVWYSFTGKVVKDTIYGIKYELVNDWGYELNCYGDDGEYVPEFCLYATEAEALAEKDRGEGV